MRYAIDLLRSEVDLDMSLLGIRDLTEMTLERIVPATGRTFSNQLALTGDDAAATASAHLS